MGLFDRLFGKKKEKVTQIQEDSVQSEEEKQDEQPEQAFQSTQEYQQNDSESDDTEDVVVEHSEESVEGVAETDAFVETIDVDTTNDKDEEAFQSENVETIESVSHSEAIEENQTASESLSESQSSSQSDCVISEEASESSSPDNHFSDIMADYYSKKTAVKEALDKGESISFEAAQTSQKQETSSPMSTDSPETKEEKYNRSLKKTRTGFSARLNAFLANFRSVDEEFFEELEELLILSDVGVTVATQLTEDLQQEAKLKNAKKPDDLKRVIIEKVVDIYEKDGIYNEQINFQDELTIMLFVGVNGVGKTTSIGKLAHKYKNQGKKVMLVAADTFRAGAVAQLVEWGRRVDVPVVTGPEKSDPASVVFSGLERAKSEQVDVLLIDTAGRLQNKDNLMKELEKIGRIIKRVVPDAPHETLLALDASTGQNALNQAKEFSKITPLTGLILTKIDGTAKGGIVLAIRQELNIPVKLIGFGEKVDDIGDFNSEDFIRSLFEGIL